VCRIGRHRLTLGGIRSLQPHPDEKDDSDQYETERCISVHTRIFHQSSGLRGIKSPWVERMAPANPQEGLPASLQSSVLRDRIDSVLRARWYEPTGIGGKEGGDQQLIGPDYENHGRLQAAPLAQFGDKLSGQVQHILHDRVEPQASDLVVAAPFENKNEGNRGSGFLERSHKAASLHPKRLAHQPFQSIATDSIIRARRDSKTHAKRSIAWRFEQEEARHVSSVEFSSRPEHALKSVRSP
jgi:hypothetical protein